MSSTDIRIELHESIEHADERLLRLLYSLVDAYRASSSNDVAFSDADIAEFEARRKSRLSGRSSTIEISALRQKLGNLNLD